jgi:WD40 repeat protein
MAARGEAASVRGKGDCSHGSEAVKLWDVTTRHEVATLAGNNALFSQVGFSPDGELLIAVNASGEAHVWRAPTTP